MKPKNIYYNFPISIIKEIIIRPEDVLSDIVCYSSFAMARTFATKRNASGNIPDIKDFQKACNALSVDLKDIDAIYNKAIELFHDNSQKQPFASIPYNMFWDYFYNVETKTEQEFAEFAAYAAARSIVGRKLYCKTNDKLLFSRMSGFGGIHSFPKPYTKNGKSHWRISGIDKYCTRKRMERLRMAIATKFGVTVYSSMGIRGFYLSFKFNYEQIIVDIAKNSKTVFKTKQDYRERIKRAEQIALKNNTS